MTGVIALNPCRREGFDAVISTGIGQIATGRPRGY